MIGELILLAAASSAESKRMPVPLPGPTSFVCSVVDQGKKAFNLNARLVNEGGKDASTTRAWLRVESSKELGSTFDVKAIVQYDEISFSGFDNISQSVHGSIVFDSLNGALVLRQEKIEVDKADRKGHVGYRFFAGICKVSRV